jgi:hypothetical protein
MVVVFTGTDGGSLATTATNRPWSIPWDTSVAVTLVYGGDGFGLVRTEELKQRTK